MENTQHTKTGNAPVLQAATSDASTRSQLVAATEQGESVNSSLGTTAATQSVSCKTWANAELEVLKSKAGLVAGALADFQAAGGLVVAKKVTYEHASMKLTATKLYLVAEGLHLTLEETPDGLDFNLVAVDHLPSGSQGVPSGRDAPSLRREG
jgi:hypothetical protein